MKTTVSLDAFIDAFQRADRTPSNFSFQGLHVLYDYLQELEEATGEEIELDVIGLCCTYAEDTAADIASNYDIPVDGLDEEEVWEQVVNFLEEAGSYVAVTEEGILYAQF
jgi:hypothetical protein